jgi:hypothetical protein
MARGPIPDRAPDRPVVPVVAPLVEAYCNRPHGGGLHVVLADGNFQDQTIRWLAEESDDPDERVIGKMLLQMTQTQRRKLAAMDFDFWRS